MRMTGPDPGMCTGWPWARTPLLRNGQSQAGIVRLSGSPSVTVDAGYAKNGETASLAIAVRPSDDLAVYVASQSPGSPKFPLTP